MDKRILLLIAVFCAGTLAFFVYRKQFYAHSGIRYEIRPGNMMIHVGDSITYQDKTEDASRWKWNFGDGEYSAEQAGTHAYLQAGHFPIQLSVFGPFGLLHDERSVLEVLPVENTAPAHPEISGAASANMNEPVTLESNTTAESYEWTVTGEPGVSGKDEHGRAVVFTFTKPGVKSIQLKLHNPDLTLNKTVDIAAPVVAAAAAPKPAPRAVQPVKAKQKPHHGHDDLGDLESGGVEVKKK